MFRERLRDRLMRIVASSLFFTGGLLATSELQAQNQKYLPPEYRDGADEPIGNDRHRGKVGAEIGGGIAGLFVGGAGLGTAGLLIGEAASDGYSNTSLIIGSVGLGIGTLLGPGVGAYLGGTWSGGRGRLHAAMLGSTASVFYTAAILGPTGYGIGANQPYAGIAIFFATPFVAAIASVAGGVVAYRKSAWPRRQASLKPVIRPYAAPTSNSEGGLLGVSVRF